jgi:hypothetical protein
MFLPASLSVFIRTTQALVLGLEQDAISTVPLNQAQDINARFGLGGVLNPDTEEVTVSAAQLPTGIDFSRVISARIGVYRVLDADSDYLLVESEVEATMLKRQPQNKQLQMLDVRFRVQIPEDEIALACTVTVTETDPGTGDDVVNTYSATAVVVSSAASQPMFRYVERFRPSVNASDTHEVQIEIPHDILVEDTDAESTLFDFDFTQPDDNILVAGAADIAYSGGGFRWLQDQDDGSGVANFTMQSLHQKPWDLPAQLMLEGASTNHFANPQLQREDAVSYGTRAGMSVVESQFDVDSFSGYQALAYACSGSLAINNEFHLDFKSVPFNLFVADDAVTGSVLMETTQSTGTTSGSRNRLGYALVLRYLDGSGLVVHENKKVLPEHGVPVFDIVSVQDAPAVVVGLRTLHPEIVSVGLRVLVTGVCPGDRFTVTVAAPQLETGAVAGSRIRGGSVRRPDTLVLGAHADTITSYDNAYGMFRFRGVPLQDRVLTAQTLFDTRAVTNPTGMPNAFVYGSGYWCRMIPHVQDSVVVGSLFEFGCSDADENEFVVTTTVPVLLSTTTPTTVKCLFAETGLGIVIGTDAVTTVLARAYRDLTLTPLVAPDMGIGIRVGARLNDLEPWCGALLGFSVEARSLDIETARTDSDIVSEWE